MIEKPKSHGPAAGGKPLSVLADRYDRAGPTGALQMNGLNLFVVAGEVPEANSIEEGRSRNELTVGEHQVTNTPVVHWQSAMGFHRIR